MNTPCHLYLGELHKKKSHFRLYTMIDQDSDDTIINTEDSIDLNVKTRRKISRCKKTDILFSSLFGIFFLVCIIIIVIYYEPFRTKNYGYPTFNQINEKMNSIKESLSDIRNVSIVTLGYSVEHNPIKSIQISPINELKINNSCEQSPIGKFCF